MNPTRILFVELKPENKTEYYFKNVQHSLKLKQEKEKVTT